MTAGRPIRERLLAARTVTESGCWEWQRARIRPASYGVISVNGRQEYAHRAAYEAFVGPIPAGLTIDHLCGNKGCIAPAHLEPVTSGENQRRAVRVQHPHPNAPTTCKRGHDWSVTPPYVSLRADGSEQRRCRVCKLAAVNARGRRVRAARATTNPRVARQLGGAARPGTSTSPTK